MLDEEILELMRDYDLDQDEAERLKNVMDEHDIEPEDALELMDDL